MRREELLAALRLVGWRLTLPVLRRVQPIEHLVRLTAASRDRARDPAREEASIRAAARLWRDSEAPCLERSLALHRQLGLAGARPALVLGLSEERVGHAWVELDGKPLLERRAPAKRYPELMRFDASGGLIRRGDS